MADPKRRLPENAPGDFYVDASCIDCDTCRQLAPDVFAEGAGRSYVRVQPPDATARRGAYRALLACPTASIGHSPVPSVIGHSPVPSVIGHSPVPSVNGSAGPQGAREAMADFPLPVAEGVWYLGYTSKKSFGAASYLLARPDGTNWMVDAPRYLPPLAKAIEALGGLSGIFLTHRDDVADAALYASRFGAPRVIHAHDRDAEPEAEWVLEGEAPVTLAPGLVALPTPGHTRGHMVLSADDTYLFTGDHLAWDRDAVRLTAFHDACWHDWGALVRSMATLRGRTFSWVLPGHGDRVHLPAAAMAAALDDLLARL